MRPVPAVSRMRLRSGVRFGVAIVVADAATVAVFGDSSIAMFGSFAVVALLFFSDFDGSAGDRLVAFGAATIIGMAGVAIGTLVAGSLPVSVAATLVIGFASAFTRPLRGFFTRSTVGIQLAFLLAVVLPAKPEDLGRYLASWALGGAVATATTLVVLPRRHSGRVRAALATWCRRAAVLARALVGAGDVAVAASGVRLAMDRLVDLSVGIQQWPGSLTRRMRALNGMFATTESATLTMEEFSASPPAPDCHAGLLGEVAADAFDNAAEFVALRSAKGALPILDIEGERRRDLEQVMAWTAESVVARPATVVTELVQHHMVLVLSIVGEVMQGLALTAGGSSAGTSALGVTAEASPAQLVRSNLTPRSIWFRNAVRVGVGAATAVLVARILGLADGFWVVLVLLSLLQVSFSGRGVGRVAVRAASGAMIGLAVGAGLVTAHPPVWVFAVLLPLAAMAATVGSGMGPGWGQGAFSFFIVINVSLLGWPPSLRIVAVRFQDVLIGIAVAAVVTLFVFPRGLGALLANAAREARAGAEALLAAATGLLVDPVPDRSGYAMVRAQCAGGIRLFSQELDAVFHAASERAPELDATTREEAWLRQVMVAADVFDSLSLLADRPADVPALAEMLAHPPPDRPGAIATLVLEEPGTLARRPGALVTTVWAAWWIDHLGGSGPGPVQAGQPGHDPG